MIAVINLLNHWSMYTKQNVFATINRFYYIAAVIVSVFKYIEKCNHVDDHLGQWDTLAGDYRVAQ